MTTKKDLGPRAGEAPINLHGLNATEQARLIGRKDEEIVRLRAALLHLRNEVSGSLYLDGEAIRTVIGNTNFVCIESRLQEAEAALAQPAPVPDSRYYDERGQLKWGYPRTVAHLVLQLQTLDPEMRVSSVLHLTGPDGKPAARAYGLSMSRERWDIGGWLNFELDVPECLAVWATQHVAMEGVNGPEVKPAPLPEGITDTQRLDWLGDPMGASALDWAEVLKATSSPKELRAAIDAALNTAGGNVK